MNGRIRIVGALLIGGAIIGSAFMVEESPTPSASVIVATGDTPERTYIPITDANNDGTDDWKETLRGDIGTATPVTSPFVGRTATSTYEADTMTEQFAQTFFEDFARGTLSGGVTDENAQAFVGASIESFEKKTRDRLYTHEDILIGEDGFASLRAYGNTIAEIMLAHPLPGDDALSILQRSFEAGGDATVLADLDPIIEMQKDILSHLLETPVPPTLRKQHFDLVNVHQALVSDVIAMQEAYVDPMFALVRLKRYQEDSTALLRVYNNIYEKLDAENIVYSVDEPMYTLTGLLESFPMTAL